MTFSLPIALQIIAAALASVLSFVMMGMAYFWAMFAVAAPLGARFGCLWFDRFGVRRWNVGRRSLVALSFFLLSIGLILLAVWLALLHL